MWVECCRRLEADASYGMIDEVLRLMDISPVELESRDELGLDLHGAPEPSLQTSRPPAQVGLGGAGNLEELVKASQTFRTLAMASLL